MFCDSVNVLAAVCLLQAWMMWNFITFHLKRLREKAAEASVGKKKVKKTSATASGAKKSKVEEDVNELPEVDQNTKITQRKSVKGKH